MSIVAQLEKPLQSGLLSALHQPDSSACCVCRDIAEEPVMTTCCHTFCRQCLASQARTTSCYTPIASTALHQVHHLHALHPAVTLRLAIATYEIHTLIEVFSDTADMHHHKGMR